MIVTREQIVKLTIFLLIVVGLTAGLVALFIGTAPWRNQTSYSVLVPDSVHGLELGATVSLQGLRIGKVSDLRLTNEGSSVEVELSVDPEVKIPSDAKAVLKFQGLTGLKVIDIVGGTAQAQSFEPGSTIPYERSPVDLLGEQASNLALQAGRLLENSGNVAKKLDVLLGEVDSRRTNAILANTEQLLDHLDRTAEELHLLLKDTRQPLTHAVVEVSGTMQRADTLLENADILVHDLHGVVQQSDDDLRSTTYNLRQASEFLEELARSLRERPSQILFDRPPEERKLP